MDKEYFAQFGCPVRNLMDPDPDRKPKAGMKKIKAAWTCPFRGMCRLRSAFERGHCSEEVRLWRVDMGGKMLLFVREA